jgi:hypothetical protein
MARGDGMLPDEPSTNAHCEPRDLVMRIASYEAILLRLGFSDVTVDGQLREHRSVAAFQKARGLEQNGLLNAATQRQLELTARAQRLPPARPGTVPPDLLHLLSLPGPTLLDRDSTCDASLDRIARSSRLASKYALHRSFLLPEGELGGGYGYSPSAASSPSGPKIVRVRSYTRRDGTYVRSHYRSAPRR